jgi:glycosyltransferase involved in cell wall biosynthesis
MLWRLYRYAGTLLVAHEHLRGRLIGEFGVEPGRIEIVPLPIREIERRDRVSGQDSIVLFFGKFRRNKGIEILLEAINELSRNMPQARFHFAGRGVDELERLVADAARKNPQITAEIGFISDERRDELFARAELVVLPYTSFASQSGVLGDAYAFQVPLVATDVGALGDSIRADRTGWVVAPGDAGALAGAIKEAIHDPPARARASAAAAAASEERTVARIGRRIREIYDRVVQAHRRQTVG